MIKDFVSDMLVRLRNSSLAKHAFAYIPYTDTNFEILKILLKQGYVDNLVTISIEKKVVIKVTLKYEGIWIKFPYFSTLKRVSRPGRRVFSSYKDFYKNLSFLRTSPGIAIISTSIGVMTHIKAEKLKKGGEILCYID